jgi:hypothetical protein
MERVREMQSGNTATNMFGMNPLCELRENGLAGMRVRTLPRKNLKKTRRKTCGQVQIAHTVSGHSKPASEGRIKTGH